MAISTTMFIFLVLFIGLNTLYSLARDDGMANEVRKALALLGWKVIGVWTIITIVVFGLEQVLK